jgi:serine phosphatase RsbU (regulator of sigma subunit)
MWSPRVLEFPPLPKAPTPPSLPPPRTRLFDQFCVAVHSQNVPASSGQFYDIVESRPEGVLLAVGDVIGHEAPKASFARKFRTQLRANADLLASPGQMLSWLNQVLFVDPDVPDVAITAQLAFIDKAAGCLCVASAGHFPAWLAQGSCDRILDVSGDGPPLGISRNAFFVEERVPLTRPSHFLMMSDGLNELRDAAGEVLGPALLKEAFLTAARKGGNADAIRQSFLRLSTPQHDDGPPAAGISLLLQVEGKTP